MSAIRSVLLLSTFALALPALAATLTVTSTDDTSPTATAGSLRAALANAADGDTITFDSSIAGQTITIAGTLAAAADTSLVIDGKALTIAGPQGGITINGGWNYTESEESNAGSRIFLVTNTTAVTTIRNLTLTGGHLHGQLRREQVRRGVARSGFHRGLRGENCGGGPVFKLPFCQSFRYNHHHSLGFSTPFDGLRHAFRRCT